MATPPQEALKKCTSCGSLLPAAAFNRRTKSQDGRASACRRCASVNRQSNTKPRRRNEMRAAIKAGNFERVRDLFSSTSFEPDQLLTLAAQNYSTARKHAGHTEIVDFLIAQGARPGCGTLFEAARDGSQAIVDRLVAGGAGLDIFACSLIGDLGLVANHLERDRRVAQARAPREISRYRDFTPLHCCCLSGLGRTSPTKEDQLLEVGKLLLRYGADVDAQGTFYGGLVVTPLDMLAHTGGNLELSRFLIAKGAKISSFAFVEALAHRGRSIAEGRALAGLFLESGFEINSRKEDGTALHAAANSGVLSNVKWLLEHGADVNARGRMGRTPLHLAVERNASTKTVETLVAWGADMHAKDDQGLTALDAAEHHGKTAVARWLRSALAKTAGA
jgi:Ankyrin repeats (3 copies)/Ankyrin repeat